MSLSATAVLATVTPNTTPLTAAVPSGTLTLISGNDTTIKGAQLTGNQVVGAIGKNLLIQSEQDTDDYASQQWQAGGKVVIGYGSGGSLSYNQSKMDSHYQSVNGVSGIQAGDGGFQLAVGNNTHLIDGVIGSSADPSNNLLNTGSLTYENLHNEANYSASSVGVSANYSAGGGFGGAPILGVPQKGNSRSDTNSGIAQGTIIVRDNPNQDLGDLDRNPTLGNQALKPIFDAQKVQENMELGQIAGQVGMRAAGDLANQMDWAEGSTERAILHGVVGAGIAALGGGNVAQGALGAAANQLVIQQMADYLRSQGYKPGTPEFASMLQLASTAVGAAVGGGTGAATALYGTTYNYLSHPQLKALQDQIKRCDGDQVCIQTAQTDAEKLSAKQEKDLVKGCYASGVNYADQYRDGISTAIDYVNDPLATQLGLQVDQYITAQDYVNNRGEWGLVKANNAVNRDGELMFAAPVAGAGTAAAIAAAPAVAAWGQDAWAAYQTATQGYSLGAAMGSGAAISGMSYTLGTGVGALKDTRQYQIDFGVAFDQRFSGLGLIGTMFVGAMGGVYQTAMFRAAGVANSITNLKTAEGVVIRANQNLITTTAKKTVNAATQDSTLQQSSATKK